MQTENNKETNVSKNSARLKKKTVSRSKNQKIEQSLSFINVYLDYISYGVISLNYKGEISGVNRQFIEMWDIVEPKKTLDNDRQCKLYLESKVKNTEKIEQLIWNKIQESEDGKKEILELKDGRILAIESFCQKLEEKIVGRVYLICDISELTTSITKDKEIGRLNQTFLQKESKSINFALADERSTIFDGDKLRIIQQSSNAKSFFLSKLCHQFRSLLNVVSFSNSLLKRSLPSQNKKEHQKNLWLIGNIQTGVEEIIQLLDELVFYGQIENGITKCQPNEFDLNLFCEEIITRVKKLSLEKQQTIEFNSSCAFSQICLDKQLLQQMLDKLLINALKYSPENSTINLNVSCQEQKIIFKIKDRGIGIKQEDMPRIFEPFFRGNNITGIKGNGIGLAIVKAIVAMQGGAIDVSSQIDIGTTFAVTLPLC